ncbi:MAG: hypothetical protein J0H50_10605 [Xanthomonadales bacterium]|nr:hypothetical protein [Xanthomonadales bacterium]
MTCTGVRNVNRQSPHAKPKRATSAQRAKLLRCLARGGLVPARLSANDRTGTAWRAVFYAAGVHAPLNACDWPTVDEWVSGLTVEQAQGALKLLLDREARA